MPVGSKRGHRRLLTRFGIWLVLRRLRQNPSATSYRINNARYTMRAAARFPPASPLTAAASANALRPTSTSVRQKPNPTDETMRELLKLVGLFTEDGRFVGLSTARGRSELRTFFASPQRCPLVWAFQCQSTPNEQRDQARHGKSCAHTFRDPRPRTPPLPAQTRLRTPAHARQLRNSGVAGASFVDVSIALD